MSQNLKVVIQCVNGKAGANDDGCFKVEKRKVGKNFNVLNGRFLTVC